MLPINEETIIRFVRKEHNYLFFINIQLKEPCIRIRKMTHTTNDNFTQIFTWTTIKNAYTERIVWKINNNTWSVTQILSSVGMKCSHLFTILVFSKLTKKVYWLDFVLSSRSRKLGNNIYIYNWGAEWKIAFGWECLFWGQCVFSLLYAVL